MSTSTASNVVIMNPKVEEEEDESSMKAAAILGLERSGAGGISCVVQAEAVEQVGTKFRFDLVWFAKSLSPKP